MSIVKSFSVGNGDMFYINHNSSNFTMIDCCLCDENEAEIVNELKRESEGKEITRFISTHPDDDHIGGLVYLHKRMDIINFYTVKNNATKKPECWTEDFGQYTTLRDDAQKAYYVERGCSRRWMNQSGDNRGSSGINFQWPILSNKHYKDALDCAAAGESPNNISPIFSYSQTDGAEFIWMGDLESDFQKKVENEITLHSVDVLFAPHHGRDSGKVAQKWLDEMKPNLIIIGEAPSQHLCYYPGYNTITQNSAGAITFDCADDGKIHIYVENEDYSVNFLTTENKSDAYGGSYLGTLVSKAAKKKKAATAAGR